MTRSNTSGKPVALQSSISGASTMPADMSSRLLKDMILRDVRDTLDGNHWSYSRNPMICKKDGYEIFYNSDERYLELSIKNPETSEREDVLIVNIDASSPQFVAAFKYVLSNAESIVHEHQND